MREKCVSSIFPSVRGCTAYSAWKVGCSTQWLEAMSTLLLKVPVSTAGSTSGLWDGIQVPWSGLVGACGHAPAPAHASTPCYVSLHLEQSGKFTSASVGLLNCWGYFFTCGHQWTQWMQLMSGGERAAIRVHGASRDVNSSIWWQTPRKQQKLLLR